MANYRSYVLRATATWYILLSHRGRHPGYSRQRFCHYAFDFKLGVRLTGEGFLQLCDRDWHLLSFSVQILPRRLRLRLPVRLTQL